MTEHTIDPGSSRVPWSWPLFVLVGNLVVAEWRLLPRRSSGEVST